MPFAAKNLRPCVAEIHCMRFFILHTLFCRCRFAKTEHSPANGKQKQMHSFYITPVRHYFLVTKLVLFCGLPQFLRIKKIFISIKTRLDACSQNALRKQRYCAVLPCAEPFRNVDWRKYVCIAQSHPLIRTALPHNFCLCGELQRAIPPPSFLAIVGVFTNYPKSFY